MAWQAALPTCVVVQWQRPLISVHVAGQHHVNRGSVEERFVDRHELLHLLQRQSCGLPVCSQVASCVGGHTLGMLCCLPHPAWKKQSPSNCMRACICVLAKVRPPPVVTTHPPRKERSACLVMRDKGVAGGGVHHDQQPGRPGAVHCPKVGSQPLVLGRVPAPGCLHSRRSEIATAAAVT